MYIRKKVETFARIREASIDTPVVALTANTGGKYMELYKEKGFEAFIGKPMKIEDVIAAVRNILHL